MFKLSTVLDKQVDVACSVATRGNPQYIHRVFIESFPIQIVPLINISPELNQTFGDGTHVIDDSLGQNRDLLFLQHVIPSVVESVRLKIDGALHDLKRLLGVFGVDGGSEGVAGIGACVGQGVWGMACLGTWAVDEVLSRIVRIELFDCGLREGGPDCDLVRSEFLG